jgi:hypothetical protein
MSNVNLSGLPAHIRDNKAVKMAIIDKSHNALLIHFDGKVELEIHTEKGVRNIGTINDKTLFVDRDSEKHLHRKSNAYGFNYYLLKNTDFFKWVLIKEDGQNIYVIPKETIIEFGQVMYFKNSSDGNSFEVQIFLNLDIIKTYKQN